jgi:hypothetical protein
MKIICTDLCVNGIVYSNIYTRIYLSVICGDVDSNLTSECSVLLLYCVYVGYGVL